MARAATETQKAGLSGLEFGLAIPGTVGGAVWANAGAHENDVAAVLDSADVLLADGTEARIATADLAPQLPRQPVQGTGRRGRPRARPFHLEPADAATIAGRLDEIRKLAPGAPAARDPVGRQRVPQPARRLGGPADRRRGARRA